jgi:hypothetical protein
MVVAVHVGVNDVADPRAAALALRMSPHDAGGAVDVAGLWVAAGLLSNATLYLHQ